MFNRMKTKILFRKKLKTKINFNFKLNEIIYYLKSNAHRSCVLISIKH